MAADITIDDLANPRLNDVQQAARQYGETLTVELNRHSIMEEAEATVGLSDWGDKGFVERLDLLCDEWNEDANICIRYSNPIWSTHSIYKSASNQKITGHYCFFHTSSRNYIGLQKSYL